MNNILDSYITELLLKPDPELVARRKAFDVATKGLEKQIKVANKRVATAPTLAEKIVHRSKEKEMREALRQHKLNYHVFMQALPAVRNLPSLNASH